MALITDDDAALVHLVANDSAVRNVVPVHSGHVFVLARATHMRTGRDVLLSIARPKDMDARTQLSTTRAMLGAVNDERIGIVIDRLWDRDREGQQGWSCLVSNFHVNFDALDRALLSAAELSNVSILGTLRSICKQLLAIHEAGYAHGDVSLRNIGLDTHGEAHIIDFEHTVGQENLSRPRVATTQGYTHPAKLESIAKGRYTVAEHQTWDRYALGQVFLDVLTHVSPHSTQEMTPRNERAVRLLGCLLLDGRNTVAELALGIDQSFFDDEKYTSLQQVISALDRIIGRERVEDTLPELQAVGQSVVEAGSIEPIPSTPRVRKILADPYMRYLNEFYQLGLICYIWPTATHRRREHALGTFGITTAYIRSLMADPENPLFQVTVDSYRARCILLAALLHDIGHYPLAHDFEEAHAGSFNHEARSVDIIRSSPISAIIAAPESDGGWAVKPADVASIIKGRPLDGSSIGGHLCGLFHSIISGPIDADKIDYLVRDSQHLNVKAGEGIDVHRIIRSLTVVVTEGSSKSRFVLGVRNKGRRPAELVGRIRSHMFGVAYWHHSYRAIKAMLQWIVWSAMNASSTSRSAPQGIASGLFEEIERIVSFEMQTSSSPITDEGQVPLFSSLNSAGMWRGAMPPAEAHVLRWIVERGGHEAEALWDMLAEQRWFSAILSIEHPKNISTASDHPRVEQAQQAWEALRAIEAEPSERRWLRKMQVAQILQDEICSWLEPQTEGEQTTIVRDFSDLKWQVLEFRKSGRIFLVDGTDPTRATQKPLFYTDEAMSADRSIDPSLAIPSMRSYDEACLSDEFVASNGAIRLLCHPTFAAFFASAVSQDTLISMTANALSSVAKGHIGSPRPEGS